MTYRVVIIGSNSNDMWCYEKVLASVPTATASDFQKASFATAAVNHVLFAFNVSSFQFFVHTAAECAGGIEGGNAGLICKSNPLVRYKYTSPGPTQYARLVYGVLGYSDEPMLIFPFGDFGFRKKSQATCEWLSKSWFRHRILARVPKEGIIILTSTHVYPENNMGTQSGAITTTVFS